MDSETTRVEGVGNEAPLVAQRRRHTYGYKLEVLAQADRCVRWGELSALARREGLYMSTIRKWKAWRERMHAGDLPAAERPGPENHENLRGRLRKADREIQRLRLKLKRAELLLEVQKKASALLAELGRTDESSGSD